MKSERFVNFNLKVISIGISNLISFWLLYLVASLTCLLLKFHKSTYCSLKTKIQVF